MPLNSQKEYFAERKKKILNTAAFVLLLFAGISFITALVLNSSSGKELSEALPPEGGIAGPIVVKEDNTVYLIEVYQNVEYNNWSYVSVDLLNAAQEYMFSFGGEMWAESGYDSEGSWKESDYSYDMKVTIPKKGKYFLNFSNESSQPQAAGQINVKVKGKKGSALPHTVLGILALIAAVVVNEIANRTIFRTASNMG